jgi:hypothetical protein
MSPGLTPTALRFPLRWLVRGMPSVACPFGGTNVHWTFVKTHLTLGEAFAGTKTRSPLPRILRSRHSYIPVHQSVFGHYFGSPN